MLQIAWSSPPNTQSDEHSGQREQLTNLHTYIEAHDIGGQAVFRERKLLEFGRKSKTVEEAEDEHGKASIRLKAKKAPESADVLESLVNDGEPDDCVNQVGIHPDAAERSGEQRDAVADGKQADVEQNILQPVEEER